MAGKSYRKNLLVRRILPVVIINILALTDVAFAQNAEASTGLAQPTAVPEQQPLHPQITPPAQYQYQYMDNDAYYQPYRPTTSAAQKAQQAQIANQQQYYQAPATQAQAPAARQPAQQQQPLYSDNDNYYQQYAPAAGNPAPRQQQQAPAQQAAQPVPGNPQPGQAPAYTDNDATYNSGNKHFYDPMYDY